MTVFAELIGWGSALLLLPTFRDSDAPTMAGSPRTRGGDFALVLHPRLCGNRRPGRI